MYRDGRDSPDYSAPPGPSSRRRSPSPSYSPPRRGQNSYTRRGYSPNPDRDYRDYSEKSKHFRPRSRSRSRSRSPIYDRKPTARNYLSQYDEDLRSLHCRQCDIPFNDRDSMVGHLNGYQHLMQLRRLKDHELRNKTGKSLNDNLVPSYDDYDEDYWKKNKGSRKLRPEQERFLDTERLDAVPANFNPKNYDHGQYKFDEKELHCEDCNVWVRSRDQMQAHKEGQNHKKKSQKVQRFRCQLCLIEVPCQDTLNNHMRGKDHIKREKQLAEQRKQRGDPIPEENDTGYKIGPMEMAKLNDDKEEENKRLRLEVKNLRAKLVEYQDYKKKCIRDHGNQDEFRKYKQYYLDNHVRPDQLARGGLHVKKEEPRDDWRPSTSGSSRVKEEPRIKREERSSHRSTDEYVEEQEEEEEDIVVIPS